MQVKPSMYYTYSWTWIFTAPSDKI